ncbi:MAG: hypothetical protein INR65_17975 [Gluconacetobacter diazotrophicus]|nr:hypothetical protein [Gluconacetobacter diazotrophicus]
MRRAPHATSEPAPAQAAPASAPALWPRLPAFRVRRLQSDHGLFPRVHPADGTITVDLPAEASGEGSDVECLLLSFDDHPDASFLVLPASAAPVQMKGEIRISPVLRFALASRDERVTLRNPTSHCFLTALPPSVGGALLCDRTLAHDWECFRLLPAHDRQHRRVADALRLDGFVPALSDPSVLLAADDPAALLPILLVLANPAVTAPLRRHLGAAMRYIE